MAYRSRSKYTPGGGVLAFFEQVSRFVSLSVLGWIVLSLFLILFFADGKITDSLDLRLVKGIFTDWRLFGTAIVLVALNGVLGGLIALPAAIVLLLIRQYLDYRANRSVRRGGAFKLKIVKGFPVAVLLLSHVVVLFLNLVAAPQLTRHWFKDDSHISSVLVGSHYILTSITRTSFGQSSEAQPVAGAPKQNSTAKPDRQSGRHLYLVMMPADFIESDDFKSEQTRLRDAVTIPYIIPKSNINEQLEALFADGRGSHFNLARKSIQSPKDYGKLNSDGTSKVLMGMSRQIRFGRQLSGLGTDSLGSLKNQLTIYESQRRLVMSQFQIFGVFRLFEGIPFLGNKFNWLDLVSDDVARIRSGGLLLRSSKETNSISVLQLSGIENRFSNIQTPFRPVGWPSKISTYERRLITRNTIRELMQYFQDIGTGENSMWAIIPYADDKRINPMSSAILKSDSQLLSELNFENPQNIGALNEELGRVFLKFFGEKIDEPVKPIQLTKNTIPKLKCFETEVDPGSPDFQFQPVELRERSLGELLNSLVHLSENDLSFMNRSSLNLISRDPGFGFLCRTEHQTIDEFYLLKHRTMDSVIRPPTASALTSSILVSKSSNVSDSGTRQQVMKNNASSHKSESVVTTGEFSLKSDVLDDFVLYQLSPIVSGADKSKISWRLIDEREGAMFFSKFQTETLSAIETFARARIR